MLMIEGHLYSVWCNDPSPPLPTTGFTTPFHRPTPCLARTQKSSQTNESKEGRYHHRRRHKHGDRQLQKKNRRSAATKNPVTGEHHKMNHATASQTFLPFPLSTSLSPRIPWRSCARPCSPYRRSHTRSAASAPDFPVVKSAYRTSTIFVPAKNFQNRKRPK